MQARPGLKCPRFETVRIREEAKRDFLRLAGLAENEADRALMLKCAMEVQL